MAVNERTEWLRRVSAVAMLVVLAACSAAGAIDDVAVPESAVTTAESASNDDESETGNRVEANAVDDRQASVDPSGEPLSANEVDDMLDELESDGFCEPLDFEEKGIVTAMHFVVRGEIQFPCYVEVSDDGAGVVSEGDQRLLVAWDVLTSVASDDFVDDIGLIAGYEPCSSCETLGFVSALDDTATFFVLALDVVAAENDPHELRLTLMHELTHVFAQTPGEQLDITSSATRCATYYNGGGCFTADSYMWHWIQEFWPPELLATMPTDGSASDDDDAYERCRADPGYTGSYAAVHPEEDFAESFSAYVLDVELDSALLPKFAFFDRYPEFVAIRENARKLGFSRTEANFDGCGP